MSKLGAFFVGMGIAFLISLLIAMSYPWYSSYIYSEAYEIYRDTGDARALEIQSMASAISNYIDNFTIFLLFASPISLAIGGILLWRSRPKDVLITNGFYDGGIMEANLNVLLENVREMKKKLGEMEIELLKLKADMLKEEEVNEEEAEELERLAEETFKIGKPWEEIKKELGL